MFAPTQTQIREQQLVALGYTAAIDAPNRIASPPESFAASEGIYTLREEIILSIPPPHPSEPLVVQPNPIGTSPLPTTAGTQACILSACAPRQAHSTDSGSVASSVSGNSTASDSIAAAAGIFSPLTPLLKRKKPKNNIAKTNSSFVSRIITPENIQKRLAERKPDDVYAFVNVSRAYEWLDATTPDKANPICHDINHHTRTHDHIDVIIGFSTGDIICYNPIPAHKQGVINPNPVQQIRWIPRSENTFMALFTDGTIVIMDKEREDTAFRPANPLPTHIDRDHPHANGNGHASKIPPPTLKIHKSLALSTPPISAGKKERELATKYNPLSYWELTHTTATAMDFSHDGKFLAVTSMQGHLALILWEKELLTDVFTSYYGGLGCLVFSPDSRYLLCGGQDDIVSVFSVPERRFGSVGDDGRLLLWELSSGTLVIPKQLGSARPGHDRSGSVTSCNNNPAASTTSLSRTASTIQGITTYHPVIPRRECPTLAPIVGTRIDDDPLCQIHFREREIITTCREGHIKVYDRPGAARV